ncbi:hypothetical protein [Verrucomicrobium spinosum]|uniref:hypothetical protein n=1 Tax=Verrucomicrobium spinosum TaxID=2736 RepID=UPI000946473A|nr:hypothetical protein [Verrucomicrobium spinosum]
MSTRTTSKPVTIPAPTEAQARAALATYIESHLQAEAIHNQAKQEIERIKKEADDKPAPSRTPRRFRKPP